MPVAQDEPLLPVAESAVLLQDDQEDRMPRGTAMSMAAMEEIEELRDTVRQLYVRIEFLENLFREHVRACEAEEAGWRQPQLSHRQAAAQPEIQPEVFPPRKERHKRRRAPV